MAFQRPAVRRAIWVYYRFIHNLFVSQPATSKATLAFFRLSLSVGVGGGVEAGGGGAEAERLRG